MPMTWEFVHDNHLVGVWVWIWKDYEDPSLPAGTLAMLEAWQVWGSYYGFPCLRLPDGRVIRNLCWWDPAEVIDCQWWAWS